MNFFPENKIAHFISRIPTPIELQGEWEVALSEFMYPHTWYNINPQNNLYGYDLGDGKKYFNKIPPGYYDTVPDILNAMMMDEFENKINLSFNPHTHRTHVKVKNKATLILENGLAQTLGFKPDKIASPDLTVETSVLSNYIADPCINYRVLYLYSDIVEPQIVGDIYAPLLRVVNVSGNDGDMVNVLYDRPHYLPVNRKMIETLELVIRTHTGELCPFERGKSIVKLHFRQKFLA